MSNEPTEIDWAQLAAYIDGEGCIGIYETTGKKSGTPRWSMTVTVVNVDVRLIHWFKATFTGSVWARKTLNRPIFYWQASNKLAIKVLKGCLPYFKIKREQAEEALAFRDTLDASRNVIPEEVTTRRRGHAKRLKDLKWVAYPLDAVNSDPEAPLEIMEERTV